MAKNVWKSINKALKKDSKVMRGAGKALGTANDVYAELQGRPDQAALVVAADPSPSVLSAPWFYPAAGAGIGILVGGPNKLLAAAVLAGAGFYFRDKLAMAFTGLPTTAAAADDEG